MCVVCVAGEVDSVRAKYGTWDTHGEAFTLLHERTFTSPGPWPLSCIGSGPLGAKLRKPLQFLHFSGACGRRGTRQAVKAP